VAEIGSFGGMVMFAEQLGPLHWNNRRGAHRNESPRQSGAGVKLSTE